MIWLGKKNIRDSVIRINDERLFAGKGIFGQTNVVWDYKPLTQEALQQAFEEIFNTQGPTVVPINNNFDINRWMNYTQQGVLTTQINTSTVYTSPFGTITITPDNETA